MKKRIAAILGIIVSSIYLMNFSFGVMELPDYLPLIGNLDEFGAAILFIASAKHFGYDFTNFLSVRSRSSRPVKS